ncbi:fungal-specific transcription factor domain-containing protein [Hypomontagnella monticulosa]|nr:fungal-specific transcription factor domain-containing protein [Hypomontagnella monticulosa]
MSEDSGLVNRIFVFYRRFVPKMSRTMEKPNTARGLEKRKACDLCHIKKIRCDAKKPICSHCIVYGAQCNYTPHIKKRRKEVQIQTNVVVSSNSEEELGRSGPTSHGSGPSDPGGTFSTVGLTLSLPPLGDVQHIIQDYFDNLNSITPIFDRSIFMRMLDESSNSSQQSPVIKAAVNVILALTFQYRATAHSSVPPLDPATCISNAQSSINDIATWKQDLLTLQVLLGLVMLHLGIPHSGLVTAGSLMGSAVKLAHRLRLHQSKTNALFDAQTALQRVRVFWIVYVFDRSISLRTCDPPLQQENDHNVAIPCSVEGSGLVRFTTEYGTEIYLDLFQSWIRLARIQGIIYEQMYSIHAETKPANTKQRKSEEIYRMLREWLATIPGDLCPDRLAGVSPKPVVRQLVALYFTCLSCFLQAHRVCSHDAEWIKRLVDYSQRVIGSTDAEPISNSELCPFTKPSSAWVEVVGSARECARLFRTVEWDDSGIIWSVACTYVSATLVLIANTLTVSEHECDADADADAQLVAEALAFLARGSAEAPDWTIVQKLHTACAELSCRARIARAKFALGRPGPKPASVAWLEAEARRSAGHSALALVDAFSMSDEKPLELRLWRLVKG